MIRVITEEAVVNPPYTFSYEEPVDPLISPWFVAFTGLGIVALASVWAWLAPSTSFLGVSFPVFLAFLGLVAAGAGVAVQLPLKETPSKRAGLLGILVLAALLTREGGGNAWDSLVLLSDLLLGVSLAGLVLLFLPVLLARLLLLLLVLFHLAGLAVAVLMVPPPNGPPPWLAQQVFTRVYRPYLQLLHLNNGYHFYAPEPGPVLLLRFRVEFEDQSALWIRLPDHERVRNDLELRRQGALANALGLTIPGGQLPEFPQLLQQRREAGDRHIPPLPLPPGPEFLLFRPLAPQAQIVLTSYVRHVILKTPHPEDPGIPVRTVKAYRLDYSAAHQGAIADGLDPLDPTLYQAFYLGEFDRHGTIKPECFDLKVKDGKGVRTHDPFLYWQLPIYRVRMPDGTEQLVNGLRLHAGERDKQLLETMP